MIKGEKHKRNETAIDTVAKNIKKCRLEKKMTQTELANIVGVDYLQISRMERGKVNPSISIIFDIAVVLEIPPAKLLE